MPASKAHAPRQLRSRRALSNTPTRRHNPFPHRAISLGRRCARRCGRLFLSAPFLFPEVSLGSFKCTCMPGGKTLPYSHCMLSWFYRSARRYACPACPTSQMTIGPLLRIAALCSCLLYFLLQENRLIARTQRAFFLPLPFQLRSSPPLSSFMVLLLVKVLFCLAR